MQIEAPAMSADFEHLRLFPLPSEALAELQGRTSDLPHAQPLRVDR